MKTRHQKPSTDLRRIQRAVATSTAIETGASVKNLETLLKKRQSKFKNLKLAH